MTNIQKLKIYKFFSSFKRTKLMAIPKVGNIFFWTLGSVKVEGIRKVMTLNAVSAGRLGLLLSAGDRETHS